MKLKVPRTKEKRESKTMRERDWNRKKEDK